MRRTHTSSPAETQIMVILDYNLLFYDLLDYHLLPVTQTSLAAARMLHRACPLDHDRELQAQPLPDLACRVTCYAARQYRVLRSCLYCNKMLAVMLLVL